jgi:hypothetical protein
MWVTVGLGLGVGLAFVAYRRLEAAKKAARDAVSPDGIGRALDRAVVAASGWADEVRQAAGEREAELRRTLLGDRPSEEAETDADV